MRDIERERKIGERDRERGKKNRERKKSGRGRGERRGIERGKQK